MADRERPTTKQPKPKKQRVGNPIQSTLSQLRDSIKKCCNILSTINKTNTKAREAARDQVALALRSYLPANLEEAAWYTTHIVDAFTHCTPEQHTPTAEA